MNKTKKILGYCVLLLPIIIISGCAGDSPKTRPGTYPFNNVTEPGSLGHHKSFSENNGVVYTCRGAQVDLAHLRIAADHTYHLYNKISKLLNSGDIKFTYGLGMPVDPAVFHVNIKYPANFNLLPESQRQKVINDVSLELAQQVTWYMVTWHEIATWFGMTFLGAPQFHSAFAWEDSYSNLMGTVVGAKAIRRGGNFNDAMTDVLEQEIATLDPQPKSVGELAADRVQNKWFTRGLNSKMLMRNLDLGLDDGFVSPAIVPGMCPGSTPMSYPVPKLEATQRHGFVISIEIKSGFGKKCLQTAYAAGRKGWVVPARDFPTIMECISQEAREKGYLITK